MNGPVHTMTVQVQPVHHQVGQQDHRQVTPTITEQRLQKKGNKTIPRYEFVQSLSSLNDAEMNSGMLSEV